MTQTKTDNSYLSDKVALRLAHLPGKGEVRVLDCFAGKGVIWKAVQRLAPGRDIRVLPIEIKKDDDLLFHLPGDNTRFLESLDLARFDVIDLDAYGVPYDQLETIFRRGFKGVVYVTFIQAVFGQMPWGMLQELGFPVDMVKLSPALFGKRGWTYFLEYLALHGVRKVWIRQHEKKHYLAFNCGVENAER
jgi:hypothetical protein